MRCDAHKQGATVHLGLSLLNVKGRNEDAEKLIARPALRYSHAPQEPRIYVSGSARAWAWYRFDHRHLQRGLCHTLRAHAFSQSRATGHGLVKDQRRSKCSFSGRLSRMETAQQILSIFGRIFRRLFQSLRYGTARADQWRISDTRIPDHVRQSYVYGPRFPS